MTIDVFFLPRADLRKQRRRDSTFDKCGSTFRSRGGRIVPMARALPIQRPKPESRGNRGAGKPRLGGESPGRAYTFLHSLLNCGHLLTRFRSAFHWPHWLYCPHWLDWPHWPHWPQRLHWLAPLATLAALATLAIFTKKLAGPRPKKRVSPLSSQRPGRLLPRRQPRSAGPHPGPRLGGKVPNAGGRGEERLFHHVPAQRRGG